jgi:cellulose synthase/poly-beta-1,6-N-acetylglucosamine synthase-like glycosyltransferase
VQAEYALLIPRGAELKTKIGAFAFRVKNLLRPRGLHRIGLGCQLAGTGMAFPWDVLRNAPDMHGHLTEDLALGLELTLRNQTAVHCSDVRVESNIAPSISGQSVQRQRWERGHIMAIRKYIPQMLIGAIRQRRIELLILACDLAVPSLAILVMMLVSTSITVLSIAIALPSVGWLPLMVVCADAAMVGVGVAASWWVCGRDLLSASELCIGVPRYLLWKVLGYLRLLRRRPNVEWIRTER